MRTPFLLLAMLLSAFVAGCASGPPGEGMSGLFSDDWTFVGEADHPALADGFAVATWTRGVGVEREYARAIRGTETETTPETAPELARFAHRLDTPEGASAFAELAQIMVPDALAIRGTPVIADASLAGRGSNGRYGRQDAAGWEIPFGATAEPYGGGHIVELVVLQPPEPHPHLPFTAPWRLLHVRQVVYPDGSMQLQSRQTLTNDDDAARFARF